MTDICIRCDFEGVKCGRGAQSFGTQGHASKSQFDLQDRQGTVWTLRVGDRTTFELKDWYTKQFKPTIFGRCRCLANFAIGCKGRTERIQNHCVIQRLDVSVVEHNLRIISSDVYLTTLFKENKCGKKSPQNNISESQLQTEIDPEFESFDTHVRELSLDKQSQSLCHIICDLS